MKYTGFKYIKNYISYIPESWYAELTTQINVLEAVSRLTNQSVYVVDFYKGELPYLNENPVFLCGMSSEEVKNMGVTFNERFVSQQDRLLIREIIFAWLEFLEDIPVPERKLYSVRFDYFLPKQLICINMTPISLSPEGKVWLTLCIATVSTNLDSGNGKIMKKNSPVYWSYDFTAKEWVEYKSVELNDIENQILRLSIQGLTEKEISDRIFRSKDGLKSIKRRLFRKLEVNNITEAVSYAISHGLI